MCIHLVTQLLATEGIKHTAETHLALLPTLLAKTSSSDHLTIIATMADILHLPTLSANTSSLDNLTLITTMSDVLHLHLRLPSGTLHREDLTLTDTITADLNSH